jgi:hypothetical protein
MEQHIYHDETDNRFYLVELYNGVVTLKVKENGWSDVWSLPIKEIQK